MFFTVIQSWGDPGAFGFLGTCPAKGPALWIQIRSHTPTLVSHHGQGSSQRTCTTVNYNYVEIAVHNSAQHCLSGQGSTFHTSSPSSTQGDDSSPDFFPLHSAQSLSEEETEAPHFDTPLRDPKGSSFLHCWQPSATQSAGSSGTIPFSATPLLPSLHLVRRAL